MRLPTFLAPALLTASASIFATSCGQPEPIRLSSPAPAAFKQERKPVPDLAILINDDEEGQRQHQRDKDEWGERGWNALNRVCLWFEDQGVAGLPCDPPGKSD